MGVRPFVIVRLESIGVTPQYRSSGYSRKKFLKNPSRGISRNLEQVSSVPKFSEFLKGSCG